MVVESDAKKPERKTVMIVDDEPNHRLVIRKMLEREGYEVLEAKNGRDALSVLKKGAPDLILMDIMMPDMNGWEASRAIKEHKNTKEIPVVMFSVRGSEDSKDRSYKFAYANFHLGKPSRRSEILRIVKEHIKK